MEPQESRAETFYSPRRTHSYLIDSLGFKLHAGSMEVAELCLRRVQIVGTHIQPIRPLSSFSKALCPE